MSFYSCEITTIKKTYPLLTKDPMPLFKNFPPVFMRDIAL